MPCAFFLMLCKLACYFDMGPCLLWIALKLERINLNLFVICVSKCFVIVVSVSVLLCPCVGSQIECNSFRKTSLDICTCPGDILVYQCSTSGGGFTVWRGSAFDCQSSRNEIILPHSTFLSSSGQSCNGSKGAIVVDAISDESDNCFTSQLTLHVNSDTNETRIDCFHVIGNENLIGINTIMISGEEIDVLQAHHYRNKYSNLY